MGRIIPLSSNDHQSLQDLLPWYVNGQLEPAEHARVEAHLSACPECQADLRVQRQLGAEVKRLPINVEEGWAEMRRRIEEERRPRRSTWSWFPALPAGGGALAARSGWAMAAMMTLVASSALILTFSQPARYHALGAAPAPASGNLLVMFRADTQEKDMRQALDAAQAQLVGGPTPAGAYLLHVPTSGRPAALTKLRSRADVELAEPIDPVSPS